MTSWTDIALLVAPYLTGGLAGAIFNSIFIRRSASKKQRRLHVKTKQTRYTLPSDSNAHKLKLSYDGSEHAALELFEMRIANVSLLTISENPFIIEVPPESKVLDRGGAIEPVDEPFTVDQDGLKENQYRYNLHTLHPGDIATLWILIAGSSNGTAIYHYRGKEDVAIIRSQGAGQINDADDIRLMMMMMALYALGSSVAPYPLDAALQATTILFCMHPVIRLYSRWAERREQSLQAASDSVVLVQSSGPFIGSPAGYPSLPQPAKPHRLG